MQDLREGRAYFRIEIDGVLHEPDGSLFYWDVGYFDDPSWGYMDVPLHPALETALLGVQSQARTKKAGGVQFDTFVECSTRVDANAEVVSSPTGVPAWIVTPDVGKVWMLREGLVTVSGLDPATDDFMVGIELEDSTFVISDWSTDGMPLRLFELERIGYRSQRVIGIACIVRSSVSATLRAVGTFWTTEVTL
jgi:hypothetical protein